MREIIVNLINKKIWLLYVIILVSFSLPISLSTILYQNIETQKIDTIIKDEEQEEDNCITYNRSENLISITCKNTRFADISSSSQLQDTGVVKQQQSLI